MTHSSSSLVGRKGGLKSKHCGCDIPARRCKDRKHKTLVWQSHQMLRWGRSILACFGARSAQRCAADVASGALCSRPRPAAHKHVHASSHADQSEWVHRAGSNSHAQTRKFLEITDDWLMIVSSLVLDCAAMATVQALGASAVDPPPHPNQNSFEPRFRFWADANPVILPHKRVDELTDREVKQLQQDRQWFDLLTLLIMVPLLLPPPPPPPLWRS